MAKTVTPNQRSHVADAVVGELQRLSLDARLEPGDVATLKACTEDAIKLQIAKRLGTLSPAALERRTNDINAQLQNFRAFGSTQARKVFWSTVDTVLTRLIDLAL